MYGFFQSCKKVFQIPFLALVKGDTSELATRMTRA